jgi:threonine dehydratase
MSAGNHAQGVAYHAQRLGIRAVVVMPRFAPSSKVEHTRAFGAEVVLEGESLEDAAGVALALAEQRRLVLVHPYDDPQVIAGQGTTALEMLAAVPDLDALVVPSAAVASSRLAIAALRCARRSRSSVRSLALPRWAGAGREPIECGDATIAADRREAPDG